MQTYQFPKRGELRALILRVWPEKGHRPLVEQVAGYAGCVVAADGLPGYLSLAVESYCAGRSAGLRLACYASMPALIRVLVPDKEVRSLALNEYVSMLERLRSLER